MYYIKNINNIIIYKVWDNIPKIIKIFRLILRLKLMFFV